MPVEQKPDIFLSEILGSAEDFFTPSSTDASADTNQSTRLLIVLKGENSGNELDLDAALKSQITALAKKYDHNINIIALPISENIDSVDTSEALMLNAVLDVPINNIDSLSALDSRYQYSNTASATFETLLSKIETCADNNLPSSQYSDKDGKDGKKSKVQVSEYKCTGPVEVNIHGSGGCVIGKMGDQGKKGDMGEDGGPGPKGPSGADGVDGLNGVPGDYGPDGPKGQKGSPGDKGTHGIPGRQGQQGATGERGEDGERGDSPTMDWDNIFELVSDNCDCGGACQDRATDWMNGMVDSAEVNNILMKVKKMENKNLTEEDIAWIEENLVKQEYK
jgi:hypothetical protein